MVSTVQNTEVNQKDADRALVVAVTCHSVFEHGAAGEDVLGMGVAFPLLQAMQKVNERLLEGNPGEVLLFDVVLVTTDQQQQQQNTCIIGSTTHYGLEVSRFCFSSEEDFVETLLKNNVQLFVTADRDEAAQASQRGVLSALLDQQVASSPVEQLRVLLLGDTISRGVLGPMTAFLAQLGEMQRRLGVSVSGGPLSVLLLTACGGRESCGAALRTLRSRGVSVDEAYCLAGAPQGPMLALLRPHVLLSNGAGGLEK